MIKDGQKKHGLQTTNLENFGYCFSSCANHDVAVIYNNDVVPIYNDATPVYNDVTPVYNDVTPVYNDVTPVYNDVTPVYNDVTPAYLTIRPAARKGYGSIAHEAKPNWLLTRGP